MLLRSRGEYGKALEKPLRVPNDAADFDRCHVSVLAFDIYSVQAQTCRANVGPISPCSRRDRSLYHSDPAIGSKKAVSHRAVFLYSHIGFRGQSNFDVNADMGARQRVSKIGPKSGLNWRLLPGQSLYEHSNLGTGISLRPGFLP